LGMVLVFFICMQSCMTKLIADSAGLRSEAPARTISMKWGDLVTLRTATYRRSGTIYEIFSMDSAISFGQNLYNGRQLLACIDAAMSAPDNASAVAVSLPPPDKFPRSSLILILIGVFMLLPGAILSGCSISDWQNITMPALSPAQALQATKGARVK